MEYLRKIISLIFKEKIVLRSAIGTLLAFIGLIIINML